MGDKAGRVRTSNSALRRSASDINRFGSFWRLVSPMLAAIWTAMLTSDNGAKRTAAVGVEVRVGNKTFPIVRARA